MSHGNVHIGLHLDDKLVSIVAVRVEADVCHLVAWDQWELEPGLITRGLIQSELLLAQRIQLFLETHRVNPDTTCMTLGWHASRVRVSVIEEGSVEKRIEQDLERYCPFGQENTLADTSLYPVTFQTREVQAILQGMMNQTCSDACLMLNQKIHLGKLTVTPASVPFMRVRSYAKAKDEGSKVVVLLDSVSGCVYLTEQSKPVFCQNLTVGACDLLDDSEAMTWFMDELQPVLAYAKSLNASSVDVEVAVNGDKRQAYAIDNLLQRNLKSLTVHALSSEDLLATTGMQVEEDAKDIPVIALASALSETVSSCDIDPLHLVSQESKTQIRAQKQLTYSAEVVVALVLLAVLSVVPIKVKTQSVQAKSQAIASQAQQYQQLNEQIEWTKSKIDSIQKEIDLYKTLYDKMPDLNWPQVFSEVAGAVPFSIRLVDIKNPV